MTNSIFVHAIEVPVPVEEFFAPIRDEVRFCNPERPAQNAWQVSA